jgi:hypothetical protein
MNDRILVLVASISLFNNASAEPSKASESVYNIDIRRATTSENLTNADIAWHAINTYGWNCKEVISRGKMTSEGFYVVGCSSGKSLRVYPRPGKHPKITNSQGTYK